MGREEEERWEETGKGEELRREEQERSYKYEGRNGEGGGGREVEGKRMGRKIVEG